MGEVRDKIVNTAAPELSIVRLTCARIVTPVDEKLTSAPVDFIPITWKILIQCFVLFSFLED